MDKEKCMDKCAGGMRIGIYGGSFNPIHNGHTQLAASILEQGLVDELWLLVSPLNPLKEKESAGIAPYEHRLHMAQLATEDMSHVKVSDFESRLPVPSYMVNTLAALCRSYPQHVFTLIIGADNWRDFHKWHRHDEILRKYGVMVYRRPGCAIDETALPDSVKIVDTELYDISSTQIRDAMRSGSEEMVRDWLDRKVVWYIKEHGLYK